MGVIVSYISLTLKLCPEDKLYLPPGMVFEVIVRLSLMRKTIIIS